MQEKELVVEGDGRMKVKNGKLEKWGEKRVDEERRVRGNRERDPKNLCWS